MAGSNVRESTITAAIKKALNTRPQTRFKKRFGSPMGEPDLDLYGSYRGAAVFLEVKRPGQAPRERQTKMVLDWLATGALSGCVTSVAEAEQLLDQPPEFWARVRALVSDPKTKAVGLALVGVK